MIETALKNLKIQSLNQMQKAAIAVPLADDFILLAATGSGKTLGFLLPLLNILNQQILGVQAIILVPSRELALQIEQVFKTMQTGFKINACYGGHPIRIEKNNFRQLPSVVIGTPGRMAYHIRNENFDTSSLAILILDEFDKSLEFGFETDMSYIIGNLPHLNKRILTSASDMKEIPAFTGLESPVRLNFLGDTSSAPDLISKLILTEAAEKFETLFSLLCKISGSPALVFCNHRDAVERISESLIQSGIAHGVFHGGMDQTDREKSLIKLRNGTYRILLTTDLASRGLDIPEIEYVIHYQLPHTAEAFLHRNGRTARMKSKGTAYIIVSADEKRDWLDGLTEFEDIAADYPLPQPSPWLTLYIAAGRKDKINKVDIVGLLLKKGNLEKDELGLVEVLDFESYAAVKREKAMALVQLLQNQKLKNKKVKIEISR